MAPEQLDILTLSQAITAAHQHSFERQETLLREIRDQPQRYLDMSHYEQRHRELERRVDVLEHSVQDMIKSIQELPEKIMAKIESRTQTSRGHLFAIGLAIGNGLVAIALALFRH